jgi:hypothetical protein
MGFYSDLAKSTANIVVKPVKTYRQHSKLKSLDVDDESRTSSDTSSQRSMMPQQDQGRRENGRGCVNVTGAVLNSGALGFADLLKATMKGLYIDVPMAVADGFRYVPRLYGEEVRDRAPITDWKSGMVVGGLNFVTGISEGFAGLVILPYKGGEERGAAGVVIGVGKGCAGFLTKTASGEFTSYQL